MFYINGNPILENELDVLNTLRSHLLLNGISLFETLKPGNKNIQFTCPVHGGGQERKPSCGVSTVNQKTADRVTPAGTVHCFTCGYTATLEEMISYCFGREDEGAFGKQWLIKNFLTVAVEDRKPLVLDVGRGQRAESRLNTLYINEQTLLGLRYYHDYMYTRGLTDELIERYDIGYDKGFILVDADGKQHPPMECITFPVRDVSGNTLFIARRGIYQKFFHYPKDVNKPVYGLYELPEELDEVVVCESMLNVTTSVKYGKPAVALLGLGTGYQYKQLLKIPCRKFVCGFDPDGAGAKATARLKAFMQGKRLITHYIIPEDKDINDLTKEEFDNLAESF